MFLKIETYFWTSHLFALFVDLLPSRIEDRYYFFSNEIYLNLFCFGFIWCEIDIFMIFWNKDIEF